MRALSRQLERKAEGVVELESFIARNRPFVACGDLLELLHALLDGPLEAIALQLDHVCDRRLSCNKLGVMAAVDLNRQRHRCAHVHAQLDTPRMHGRATDEAAQHIASPLVGRKHAIGDAERGCANVVRNDPFRKRRRLDAVLPHMVDERLEQVGLEDVRLSLEDVGDALEPHPGVDRRVREGNEASILLLVELGEHEVPEFRKALAVVGHAVG
jgi:hypothetical protein